MIEPRVHESGERVLEVEGVGIDYNGRNVLDDVSFYVQRGEFLCLLGPNGAGKSSLLKCVLGLQRPSRGSIRILGEPPGSLIGKVGYLPQLKAFDRTFPATTLELIVCNLRGSWPIRVKKDEREQAMEALKRVKGEKLANLPLRNLSGGEIQRAFLARALVTHPEIILLDEPSAGVDPRGRSELYDLMHQIAVDDYLSAMMVTHSLAAITRTAEKVVLIDGGVVAFGLPKEVFAGGRLVELLGGHGPDAEH